LKLRPHRLGPHFFAAATPAAGVTGVAAAKKCW
jgi:hypothetical protein